MSIAQNQTDQPRLPNIVASTNVVNTLTGQLQTPQQQQQLVSSYPNLSKAISSASANGVHDDCKWWDSYDVSSLKTGWLGINLV